MHKLLDRLERRFGRYAVPNLTLLLIMGQVAVFVLTIAQQDSRLLEQLVLSREAVLSGQVWRLATFLFVPPGVSITGLNLLFTLIFWWLFYFMGSTLEAQWGEFRYNAFLFIGWIATAAATMLVPGAMADNLFLQGTVFLAFARLYPDYQLLLFFVLPIKIKWLALLAWAGYATQLLTGDWSTRAMVIAAVLNYLLFFYEEHLSNLKAESRRRSYQAKTKPVGRMRHVCAVCGRNSDDEPKLAFRYCSQCAGGQCYCPDHIKDHEHVQDSN